MSSNTSQYVFVYGTLKRGHYMGSILQNTSEFISIGFTPGVLYDLSTFPAYKLLPLGDNDFGRVYGEVYHVTNPNVLRAMDTYEGVDQGLYRKKYVPIQLIEGDKHTEVLTHVLLYEYARDLPDGLTPIEGGIWT